MRDFAVKFYKSKAWKDCSMMYRSSVGGLCERCKAKGLLVPAEIVHHKIHVTPDNINRPDLVLNFDNLEALCRNCHADMHKRIKKRYKVDKYGRVGVVKDADDPPVQ